MISVEIRYIPGIALISRSPSVEKSISLLRRFLTSSQISSSQNGVVFKGESVAGAIEQCVMLADKLSTSGSFAAMPYALPFHGVIYESTPPPEEIWKLIPQGSLIIQEKENISGASKWLYDWKLVNFTRDKNAGESLFPLKSLMILGENKEECFFCGSHFHKSEECSFCWTPPPDDYRVSALAAISHSLWTDTLRQKSRGDITITSALQYLLQDLRSQFSWHYMMRVCQSSATSFNELLYSPLRAKDSRLEEIYNAIQNGDPDIIKPSIERLKNISGDARLYITTGFYYLYKGNTDLAMNAWWDAENSAANSMIKSYSSMLQSRLHFLQDNIPAAAASSERAYKNDNTPQTLYWHILFSILKNNRRGEKAVGLRLLFRSPVWLTAIVLDPLLLQHQQEIEENYLRLFKEEEEGLQKRITYLEKKIEQAVNAFGEDVAGDTSIQLRNLLGKFSTMGLSEMKKSVSVLDKMQQELQGRMNKKIVKILKSIPVLKKRCRDILRKLPRSKKTVPIKKECLNIITTLDEISRRKKIIDPEKQKGLQAEIAGVEKQYRILMQHYREYVESVWQLNMIKKYIKYGVIFIVIVWTSIYILQLF